MYNNQKSNRINGQRKPKGNYNRIIKQKFPLKFTDESYVDEARKIIGIFKEEKFKVNKNILTNTQLRNLLAMTNSVYAEAQKKGFDSVKGDIAYLKIHFIYQSGRNIAVKAFVELAQLIKVIEELKNLKDLQRFCHYMEALVAYFKYCGGSEN